MRASPMRYIAIVLSLGLLFAGEVRAELVIDISGVPGSGTTLWEFSGSATSTSAGNFVSGEISGSSVWGDIGDPFTPDINLLREATSTGASITTASGTRDIDRIYVDWDASSNDDDFGIGVAGTTHLLFGAAETVSWTGSFSHSIDVQDLVEGSYSSNEYFGLDLTLNITHIPEPASLLLFGSFMATGFRRRR